MKIHYEKQGRIVLITMEGDNDLNVAVVGEELHERLMDYRDDDDLWCAVVTGAGTRAFTVGGNVQRHTAEARAASGEGASVWRPRRPSVQSGFELWKPMVAAISGYCIGAGMMLALACDIRICAENAQFAITEVKLGFPPGGAAMQRLPRVIGLGPAMEILLTGDRINAQQAAQWGLVNRVVSQDDLLPEAMKVAERFVANPPLAVQTVKEMVHRSLDMPMEHAMRMSSLFGRINRDTEDGKEGTRAFMEKRKPEFKGR